MDKEYTDVYFEGVRPITPQGPASIFTGSGGYNVGTELNGVTWRARKTSVGVGEPTYTEVARPFAGYLEFSSLAAPEPGTLGLLGVGLAGVCWRWWGRRRRGARGMGFWLGMGLVLAGAGGVRAQAVPEINSFNTLAPKLGNGEIDYSNGFTVFEGTTAFTAAPSDPFNGVYRVSTLLASDTGFRLKGDPTNANNFTLGRLDIAYGGFRGATDFAAAPTSGILMAWYTDGTTQAWRIGTDKFSYVANIGQTVGGHLAHGGSFRGTEENPIVLEGAAAKTMSKLAFGVTGITSDPNNGGSPNFFISKTNASIAPMVNTTSYTLVKNFDGAGEPIITQINPGGAANFEGYYASVAPEPGTVLLLLVGAVGLGGGVLVRRRG